MQLPGPIAAIPCRVALLLAALLAGGQCAAGDPPRTQSAGPGAQASDLATRLDGVMTELLAGGEAPGAALAVTKDGRLAYARGFGLADVDEGRPVTPDSLFRIASISKPITAVAILQLVEQGRIRLDSRAFNLLHLAPHLEPGVRPDPRLQDVTLLHLLQHSGGWDRGASFDPMGIQGTARVASALGAPFPPGRADVIRYMLGRPLDFAPGTRSAYSNFGYLVLGRVIERVTGCAYEEYVKRRVLRPLGIEGMRIGVTHKEDRAPGEVAYYSQGRTATARFGPHRGRPVPLPYARCIEVMDSHGGWIASAVDLARFAVAFDNPATCRVLSEASVRRMFAPPEGPWAREHDGTPKRSYYACGWSVERAPSGRLITGHGGGMEGTSTALRRGGDGVNSVLLFNTHDRALIARASAQVRAVLESVRAWPAHDLFNPRAGATPPSSRPLEAQSASQGARQP